MPHNLTEVNAFSNDGTLQVPDGTDDHHLLSSFIEFIAQTLANRSQNLKSITAKLGTANTFTAEQDFNEAIRIHGSSVFDEQVMVNNDDADYALLATDRSPANSPVSGNKWKLLMRFRSGSTAAGGQYIHVYTGRDGTTYGSFAIVLNAGWSSATQLWGPRDTAVVASALIWRYGGVYYSEVPAGTANWTDWPRQHTTQINLVDATPFNYINVSGTNGVEIPALDSVRVPVTLPHGAVVTHVEFGALYGSTLQPTFSFERMTGGGFTTIASITPTDGPGAMVVPLPVPSHAVNNIDNAYLIRVAVSEANRLLISAKITWTDPGLRNY